jgi:subtilase family serine protease
MFTYFWLKWRRQLSRMRDGRRGRAPRRQAPIRRLNLERLEERTLLSAPPVPAPAPYTPPHIVYHPAVGPYQFPGPVGYTPAQIQKAYGIDQLYGIIGNGAGQTIAIVDAYDNPSFVNSTASNFNTSDLHMFDQQFGLPDPPSFIKADQNGGSNLPGTDPNKGWEGEEALDVEWAHAIAPGANIILFEANSAAPSDLNAAVATAAATPGVSVISMSFGGGETSSDPNNNAIYTTPAGHQGVTFVAATGDSGSPGGYPAYSPNVLAVGGTNLQLNPDNSYKS